MTITEWLGQYVSALKEAGIESARLDCLILLESELSKERSWILAHEDYKLKENELSNLNKKLVRRKEREPLAYIVGYKEFYGHNFFVDKDVLIPRPETEDMIDILREVANKKQIPRQTPAYAKASSNKQDDIGRGINTIWDVGTGSGCLAIIAKLLLPDIHVMAIDNSLEALKVARKNARQHNAQIQFKHLDIYEGLPAMPETRPYIILANLPYVPDELITSSEITKEPAQALFSGTDGLDHYRNFWRQIKKLKNKPVYILIENLKPQHQELEELAKQLGYSLQETKNLIQLYSPSVPAS